MCSAADGRRQVLSYYAYNEYGNLPAMHTANQRVAVFAHYIRGLYSHELRWDSWAPGVHVPLLSDYQALRNELERNAQPGILFDSLLYN